MMKIEIPGMRTRGRLQRWWNDNIKEDIKKVDISEEAEEWMRWRMVTCCCNP